MPSKIKPIPLRMSPDLRARVQAHAKEVGKSEHAAVLSLIEQGFERVTLPAAAKPAPKEVLAQAQAKAAHLATPKPKPVRSRWNLKDVHLGPVERAPGSMLKGANTFKGNR